MWWWPATRSLPASCRRDLALVCAQEHSTNDLTSGLGGVYLYCANTLDQRQLVLVEPARRGMLESYYQEIVHGAP